VFIRRSPRIHRRPCKAQATGWFLRLASLKHAGAMSIGAFPFNQLSFQNLDLFPLPSVIIVQVLNNSSSLLLILIVNPVHGLSGAAHLYHIHLRRSALLKHA